MLYSAAHANFKAVLIREEQRLT